MSTIPVRIHEDDALTVRELKLAAERRGVKVSIADWMHRAVCLLKYEETVRPVKVPDDE